MKTVLHICLGLRTGGLERFILDLAEKQKAFIKPVILCLDEIGDTTFETDIEIIELHKPDGFKLSTVRAIAQIIKQRQIDVVHTHNPGPHLYGALASFIARKPLIHTKHGRNDPEITKNRIINGLAGFLSRKVVAVSADAYDVCVNLEKVSRRKATTILNGINTEVFQPAPDKTPHHPPVIGIVARLSPEKDHQMLLNACALIKNRGVPFQLQIIGDGPLRDQLEEQSKTLGLDDAVDFLGMRSDVAKLLCSLDLFVLSSTTEGISLTLLEAMACGLPIAATDAGGNSEVVQDSQTGYISPISDPEKLAENLIRLLESEDLRKQMGAAGRKRVVQYFSLDRVTQDYLKLYDELA